MVQILLLFFGLIIFSNSGSLHTFLNLLLVLQRFCISGILKFCNIILFPIIFRRRIEFLREQSLPCPWDNYMCRAAAREGHLEVLQWLWDKGCPE